MYGKPTNAEQNQLKQIFYYEPQETRNLPAPWAKVSKMKEPDQFEQQVLNKNVLQNLDNPIKENNLFEIINYEDQKDQYPQTKIIPLNQAQANKYVEYPIGKSKNHQQFIPEIHSQAAGGRKKQQQYSAKDCIFNSVPENFVQPDPKVGKIVATHTKKKFDEPEIKQYQEKAWTDKPCGIPTIREDLKPQGYVSLANKNVYSYSGMNEVMNFNYEPVVKEKKQNVIQKPTKEEAQKTMAEVKTKIEIREIFKNVGYQFQDSQFEYIFKQAEQIENRKDGRVSVKSFTQALQQQ